MKVYMTEKGELVVEPQSSVEDYALSKYYDQHKKVFEAFGPGFLKITNCSTPFKL